MGRIPQNKNLETEYKAKVWKGFGAGELGWIGLALLTEITGASLLSFVGVPFVVAIYAGLPLCVPVIYIGFRKHYGMSQIQYWKELKFERKTRHLTCEEIEPYGEPEAFSMKKKR